MTPVHASRALTAALALALIGLAGAAQAHNVTPGDAGYIQEIWGVHIIPFIYLGAKHMITGYDHILFLLLQRIHSFGFIPLILADSIRRCNTIGTRKDLVPKVILRDQQSANPDQA